MSIKKRLYIFLYYHFAIHLPASFSKGGRIGRSVRGWLCKRIFKQCGKNINVEKGARFGSGVNICIGDNSGIGVNADIPDGTFIGRDVMMGPNCFVISRNHGFGRTDIPMREQGYVVAKPLTIEDDCWIGRDVMITGSRTIKKGTLVAARCVLTKDFPEYSVVGGNPSRLIRNRLERKHDSEYEEDTHSNQ